MSWPMMAYGCVRKVLEGAKCGILPARYGALRFDLALYHCSGQSNEQDLPLKWYQEAFPKIEKLTLKLQGVDLIDGILVNVEDDKVMINGHVKRKMNTLKSLVRVFIGYPLVQRKLRGKMEDFLGEMNHDPVVPFSKTSEREPMLVSSLTKVSNFLNISAQRRKVVRHTICPQVTQHRIWAGALVEILNGLKSEMDCLSYGSLGKGSNIGQQIICSCSKLLADTDVSCNQDSTSWMQLEPAKGVESPGSIKWEDVGEMFNDLIKFLDNGKGLLYHIEKLEVMKEGLHQIKDVLVDKSIGYKEVRFQESLIQKKLSKTLGHPSRCLFTLVMYYLYGHVRDTEVDMCGGIYGGDAGKRFRVCMGRILTSDEEKMVWNGVKQLGRALGLFKFIWETAQMKASLELEGHLWCVGARDRTITYRGNVFFVHGIFL